MQPPPPTPWTRIAVYASLTVLLLGARIAAGGVVGWAGSAELHIVLEALASLLALVTGALALVGYYATRRSPLLVAGVTFTGTAVLDGVHTMLAASGSETADPVEWSWFLSRTFFALMLTLRLRLSEETRRAGRRIGAARTYVAVGLLTLASVALLRLPLPSAYHPGALPQPQELFPALLLIVAIAGHLRLGRWRREAFEDSFVIAMLLGLGVELFMAGSAAPHDLVHDVAHVLKITSYAVVLSGLLSEVYRSFRESALEAEQRTFQFLEHLPVGVLVLNERGVQHYANRVAKRLLGSGAEAGTKLSEFAAAARAHAVGTDDLYPVDRNPMARALHGEASVTTDMELRHEEDTVALQVHGAPVRDRDGEIMFAIAAFQDVGELRQAALEDPLTGLPNRAALGIAFSRIRALCERHEEPLCIALIDIDHFKSINDHHGHAVGDDVLRRLAEVVPGLLRGSDVLTRWGGEEFALLLPRTPLEGSAKALQKALAGFREESFHSKKGTFQVTFSAGVAAVTPDDTLAAAIDDADRHLYRAKRNGRDRICWEGDTDPEVVDTASWRAGPID